MHKKNTMDSPSPTQEEIPSSPLTCPTPCPLSYALLGLWDSRIGPSAQQLWPSEGCNPRPSLSILRYLVTISLSGTLEDEHQPNSTSDNRVEMKFYHLPSHGLVLFAFTYSAVPQTGLIHLSRLCSVASNAGKGSRGGPARCPHCLCLVFAPNFLGQCISWQSVIENYFKQRILYLRVFHEKTNMDNVLFEYSDTINVFASVLHRLQKYGLSETICLNETAFSAEFHIEDNFLCSAIASHLMTFGRSVVIGSMPSRINMMIRTLALFLPPEARRRCVELGESDRSTFAPDILIQGSKKDPKGDLDLSVWSVMMGKFPLTVIDLPGRRVYQSFPYNLHCWRQHCLHEKLLTQLYNADSYISLRQLVNNIDIRLDRILEDGTYPESTCSKLIAQMSSLNECNRQAQFVRLFLDSLRHQAALVVKFCQDQARLVEGAWYLSERALRDSLDLGLEGDFRVVLTWAEMTSPGVYAAVLGNPMRTSERLRTILQDL